MTATATELLNPVLSADAFEAEGQQRFSKANWHDAAALDKVWPLTTREVLRLLRLGGQFELSEEVLRDWVKRNRVSAPTRNKLGQDQWSATQTLILASLADEEMRYLPAPSKHDHKKSVNWFFYEGALRSGGLADLVADPEGTTFGLRSLLVKMARADDAATRLNLLPLILATLSVDHDANL